METAGAYGCECAIRRRRLTIIVFAPAYCSAVCAESAGIKYAGGYGCECPCRRRRLTLAISAPAHRCTVCAQSANVAWNSPSLGAYGCECARRLRPPHVKIKAPTHRNAVCAESASIKLAGAYGAKCQHACGCGSGGRSLLRACVVRVRQQDEQQQRNGNQRS